MSVEKTNTAAEIIGGFVQALMTAGQDAAITYAETQVPALALPVIKQIFEWIVGYFAGDLETVIINGTTSLVINVQGQVELNGAVNAATALKLAQASGDQAAIEKAVENAKSAYASAINWNGTYSSPS